MKKRNAAVFLYFALIAFILIGIPILTIGVGSGENQKITTHSTRLYEYLEHPLPPYIHDYEIPTYSEITFPSYLLTLQPTTHVETKETERSSTAETVLNSDSSKETAAPTTQPPTTSPTTQTTEQETKSRWELAKENALREREQKQNSTTNSTQSTSSTAPKENTAQTGGTVYVTNTGNAYHRRDCHYLRSVNAITLRDATIKGYWPCSACNPPIYTGELPEATEPQKPHTSGGSSGSGSSSGSSTKPKVTEQTTYTTPDTTSKTQSTTSSKEKKSNESKNWGEIVGICLIYCVLYSPGLILLTVSLVHGIKNMLRHSRDRRKQKQSLLQQTIEQRVRFAEALSALQVKLTVMRLSELDYPKTVATHIGHLQKELNALLQEHGATLNDEGLVCVCDGFGEYGRDCTVYFSDKGSCYHKHGCKNVGKFAWSAHITTAPKRLRPCSKCNPMHEADWIFTATDMKRKLDEVEELGTFVNTNLSKNSLIQHKRRIVEYSKEVRKPLQLTQTKILFRRAKTIVLPQLER